MRGKPKIKVMATGVFDLLHPGHIYYLEQARALGDELFVVVANDIVAARKGRPLFDAAARAELVAALACVTKVIVPTEVEPKRYYRTVLALDPDIICLGYDQTFSEHQLAVELAKYGWQGEIVRLQKYPAGDISSSRLKQQISRLTNQSDKE